MSKILTAFSFQFFFFGMSQDACEVTDSLKIFRNVNSLTVTNSLKNFFIEMSHMFLIHVLSLHIVYDAT
jgi:hypothetical protein